MVEVKSVKVDNWGVFFLQKLQNFFNKTDYCDLTLQFKDNSQLKVHRLVLSACTDFFNVLEQQYVVQDDILIMPKDLQADVVVPIVNFMYTGTLEFEVNMYPRLLKTAKDMNMTVLLKLLDAHKRTVGESLRQQQVKAPVLLNKGAGGNQRVNTYSRPSAPQRTYTQRRPAPPAAKPMSSRAPYGVQGVKVKTEKSPINVIRSVPSTSFIRKNLPEPVQLVAKYAASGSVKGPSRFECSDDVNTDAFESSFDNISYESKPLITSKDDHDDATFEKIKRSAAGVAVKRAYSANSSISSPPEKKPNIEEMKEFSEAQRMRKELVAQEVDEEMDYYAEDFQNEDDDDDDNTGENTSSGSVVIKSDSGGQVNHAKIISEVLKKYPHLVKNNKNIKLKILQKGNSPVTVSAITKDPTTIATSKQQAAAKQSKAITVQAKMPVKSEVSHSKPSTPVVKAAPAPTTSTPNAQPKKIDSRTMHALIAKGPENMTGPWLCLDCGVDGRPISIPTYKSFRRHLINIHKQKIDPRLCEHCGHRSSKRNDLHYHMLTKHQIKPPADLQFPKCGLCTFIALDPVALRKHKDEDHQAQGQQLCIYCNKTFQKEIQLYAHMRNNHKQRAIEDGVMDFSDEETYELETDKYVPNHPEASQPPVTESKIKVLSNITLPAKGQFIIDSQGGGNVLVTSTDNLNLEPSSEAEGLSNVASGIATSLAVLDTAAHLEGNETYEEDLQSQFIEAAMADVHGEILKKDDDGTEVVTKFITEEGSELELTAAQKAQLLEQLQGQEGQLSDNVVMVLDAGFEQTSQDNNTSAESMDVDGQSQESAEETMIKNDDSTEDELASMENVSADEDSQNAVVQEQDASNDTEKTGDEKPANKLISALEGDWSEEEEEVTEEEPEKKSKPAEPKAEEKPTPAPVKVKQRPKPADAESTKSDKGSDNAKNILDDWDSQEKFDDDSEKSVTEEKTDADKSEAKTKNDDTDSKNGDKSDKKQLAQKNELKTLIASDWGDEEEEEAF